jgi:hypothetical protein
MPFHRYLRALGALIRRRVWRAIVKSRRSGSSMPTRDHPGRRLAVCLCNARSAGFVRLFVDFQAEPCRSFADAAANFGRVFSNAGGKHQRIEAAQRGNARALGIPKQGCG